jgi:hypothetical protein
MIKEKLRPLNLTTKFFEFDQNNSGGFFDIDDNVTHRVIIEAKSEEEAIEIFKPMIEDQSYSCECCGDRWSLWTREIELESYKEKGYPASVYTHYKDYEGRWFKLYGNLPRKSEPTLIKQSWGTEFKGEIYFESIEQYAQFMANAYGFSSPQDPDIKIHYLNGTIKNIFTCD